MGADVRSRMKTVTSAQDKCVFTGELVDGKPHGHGEIICPEPKNYTYNGEWDMGLFSGSGRLIKSTLEYEGEFLKGKLHGEGALFYQGDGV